MGYGVVHNAWVLVMSAVRLALAGALVLSTIGCNHARDVEVHEIKGVGDKFCVPKSHRVGRVPWIPSGVPEGSGFAFSGCWRGDLKEEPGCLLPKRVVGGVVESIGDFRGQQWQDFDDESLVTRTISGQDALLESTDGGRTVVASNPSTYWGWFVWRKATHLVGDGSLVLDGADELIATCQMKDGALPGTSETRATVMCERNALGTDYALSYSFESEGRVPKEVEKLDAQLFAGIDSWRCRE